MKKLINIIISLIGFLFIFSCEKDPDLRMPDVPEAPTPYMKLTENSDQFIDYNNPGDFLLEFEIDMMYDDPYEKLSVAVVANNDYENPYVVKDNINEVPVTMSITASDLVNAISDLNSVSDILVGDQYNFYINATMEDGTELPGVSIIGNVTSSPAVQTTLFNLEGADAILNINVLVPCEPILKTGTYLCSASGFSTDPNPNPEDNPASDYVTEVIISQGQNFFTFTISDFSGGLFTLWYGPPYGLEGEFPGTLQDLCGEITYINTTGPYGSPISGSATIDQDTGIITINAFAVFWGDTWELVLTPMK